MMVGDVKIVYWIDGSMEGHEEIRIGIFSGRGSWGAPASRQDAAEAGAGITRGLALWELGPGLAADDLSGHETGRGQISRPGAVQAK